MTSTVAGCGEPPTDRIVAPGRDMGGAERHTLTKGFHRPASLLRLALMGVWMTLTLLPLGCGATADGTPPTRKPTGTFAIVAPAALDDAAAAWAAHRSAQGWDIVDVDPLDENGRALDPETLHARLRTALRDAAPPVAILLLGDADVIAPFRFAQPDARLVARGMEPLYVSDHPYRLADDVDELPDWSLGRVPARSVEEAKSVLEKIVRYEADAPAGAWRTRVNFVAGEGRFGFGDQVLETLFRGMVESLIPPAADLSLIYASCTSTYCPPPSKLEETVLSRLSEESLLFVYLGHGLQRELDSMRVGRTRYPLLRHDALSRLDEPRAALPLAFLGCCSSGWFDDPAGAPCLAESMLLAPGGPVAVIAGSRLTHPYGTAVFQKDLVSFLLHHPPETLGELDRRIDVSMLRTDSTDLVLDATAAPIAAAMRWPISLAQLRLMHVRMYNLFGDPATRLAHPRLALATLKLENDALVATAPGIAEGVATVTIETRRDGMREPERIEPVLGAADPELERKAAQNFAAASERVLRTLTAPVRNGHLDVRFNEPMPERAAIVRVVISGTDATGRAVEAVGGLRLDEDQPASGRGLVSGLREPVQATSQ